GDYSLDLCLLGLGHCELVKGLLKIVEKGLPLCRRYHEMLVRLLHGAACVLLRPVGGPADHFRDEVLKACRGNAMMRLVYRGFAFGRGSTMIGWMKSSITVAML